MTLAGSGSAPPRPSSRTHMSAAPAVAVLAAALGAIVNGLHTIHEGHIGVYWRGGALLEPDLSPFFITEKVRFPVSLSRTIVFSS